MSSSSALPLPSAVHQLRLPLLTVAAWTALLLPIAHSAFSSLLLHFGQPSLLGLCLAWTLALFALSGALYAQLQIRQIHRCVRAPLIALLMSARDLWHIHALHASVGAVLACSLEIAAGFDFRLCLGAAAVGFCAGLVYSLELSVSDRRYIRFPSFHVGRVGVVFSNLGMSLMRGLWLGPIAVFISALLIPVVAATIWLPQDVIQLASAILSPWTNISVLARSWVVAWFVLTTLRMLESLTASILLEPRSPVAPEHAFGTMLRGLQLHATGSLDESLQSLRIDPSSPSSGHAQRATVLELAYVASGKAISIGPRCAAGIHDWWCSVVRTVSLTGLKSPSQQMFDLVQRRNDAVIQALYTADTAQPGTGFAALRRLPFAEELARARAFRDLVVVAKSSEGRRRRLFDLASEDDQDTSNWCNLVSTILAPIDALTIQLQVSVHMSALEPTLPVDGSGNVKDSAFVLGPSPRDYQGLSGSEQNAVAWEAQRAARRHLLRPWVSRGWWSMVLTTQFREHDPIAIQHSLTTENGGGSTDKNPKNPTSRRMIHESQPQQEPAAAHQNANWEQRWNTQKVHRRRRFLAALLSLVTRSSEQQTDATLADDEVVLMALEAVSCLVHAAAKEDVSGVVRPTVPMVIYSLINLHVSLGEYESSPVFLGSNVPLPELEGNSVERKAVSRLRHTLERAIYRITTRFPDDLRAEGFNKECVSRLGMFVEMKV